MELAFFSLSFSPSRQDFGRTGNLFLDMFYWLLLLPSGNRLSLDTSTNSFVEIPCIVISGTCGQEPQQVRRAEHAFESYWASYSTSQRNSGSDLLLVLLLKLINNHFAIAIIRIIYIYSYFITVYISLYSFTYLLPAPLVNLQTGYLRGLDSYSLIP